MKSPVIFGVFFLACCTYLFATDAASNNKSTFARGYCGDGIINGNEDCDTNDLKIRSCHVLNGGEGEITCQSNCVYDISKCGSSRSVASLVDERLGGMAESCQCNFESNNCDGGCAPRSYSPGTSQCEYRCEQTSSCKCGNLLDAYVERCDLSCTCQNDRSGSPQCVCKQEQCNLIISTKPNIGSIMDATHPFMSVRKK